MRRLLSAVVASSFVLLTATQAHALTNCTALGGPPVVFIENGDTQEPLLKRLGKVLAASTNPLRIVYKNRRTCDLANDMYVGNKIVNDSIALKYIPLATEDASWDETKATPACLADAGGNVIELGIGATFLSSCKSLPAKPNDLTITDGPTQSYGFIVPPGSSQVAITAEEGYFAFGFSQGTGQAMPWVDQNLRFIRGPTASTALTDSAAIGLLATQLKGIVPPNNTSGEILTLVSGSTSAEATIGMMGTEVFDANRTAVKLLAFKGFQQRYAYFPDSSSGAFDKKNVRDGHYMPWAPTPYILHADPTTGTPVSDNARRVRDLVLGTEVDTDVNGLLQVVKSGLVPACAMGVSRPFDGGDFSLFTHPAPCECYFEANVPNGKTSCDVCSTTVGCNNGTKCRFGYCEAR
jgi:hypothetical protein